MTSNISKTIIAQSKHVETEKNYWLTKLSGTLARTYFPYDNIAPDVSTYEKHDFQVKIPDDLFTRSIQLSKGSDNNLYIILLTCLIVLLNKYTGNKDIIIAVPIFKQEIKGEFINTALTIRIQLTGKETVKELIILCKNTVFEANEYLNFPIERLINDYLELPFPGDGFSLFDTGILLENIQYKKYIEHLNLNILFSFLKTGEYIEGFIEYNSHLYKQDTIKRIGEHFIYLLQIILNNVNLQVSGIEILSGEERHRLLMHFNETKAGIPRDRTIIELFEEQVEKRGEKIVLRDGSQVSLKYKELNEKSNQLGRILKEKGVKADTIAALVTVPSVQTVIGILAVLKAGGTYLPIDPEFPAGRINYMLMDSQAHMILIQDHSIEKLAAPGEVININDNTLYKGDASNLKRNNTPGDTIYTIYTSGTSGRPKGVLIKNENLVNYVCWFLEKVGLTEKDKAILLSSFAFDLGYTSIYSSILAGGELHLIPKEIFLIPERLLDYLGENGITYLKLTPSLFSVIANHFNFSKEKCPSLRLVILGGEPINTQDLAHANLVYRDLQIMNHYGPTETTIGSIARFIDFNRLEEYKQKPTIGKPIDNTEIYILDEDLKPVPVGIPAELCIGGNGVGRGYLNQPELTASKFIAHPFKDEGRLYRTGDRARWNPDGDVEFLGRIDTQIKIRGFRIELEEIENQLLKQESIKNAVVIARQDDDRGMYLCAYYIPSNPVEITQLREYLTSKLPLYMIPSVFMELKKIPVTANGKVDHRALPEPEIETGDGSIPPMNEQQEKLAALWSSVLGIEKEKTSIDANFFELGGDSLKATTLIAKIHKAYDFQISLIELFKFPTIRGISEIINKSIEDKFASIEPVEKKEFYPLSSTQKRIYILQQIETETTPYNVPAILSIEGEAELNRIDEVYKKLIARHEALRTSFVMVGEEPVQRINKEVEFSIRYFEAFPGKQEREDVVQNFVQPFDLSRAPLMRAGLIKTGEKNYLFYIDMHHILRDAATLHILTNEFMALYAEEVLSPLKLHYKDFSGWQNSRQMQEIFKKQRKYWQQEFFDEIPVLNLPTDYPRPANQSFEGSSVFFELSETETMFLNEIARSEGATLFMLLSALFYVFLCKISSQEDIVVGTPIASRTHADLARIVGMLVNTMAIRNFIPQQSRFKEFLNDVKNKTLKAYDNQDYPFEELVEDVQVQRDLSRNPMFDVMFVLHNVSDDPDNVSLKRVKNLTITNYPIENSTSKFDLTLFSVEGKDKLRFFIEYCTRLFKEDTVLRFVQYFKKIISSVIKYPEKKISDIEILSDEEKKKILYDFNDTETEYPKDKTIHLLFEEQVQQTPDNIAVVAPCIGTSHESPQQITYKELNKKSNRLAHELQTKGVGPDTIAGIMIERSLQMIIGVLGILKAGGVYLPIDPDYPEERKRYILKDSGAKVMVTGKAGLNLQCSMFNITSFEAEEMIQNLLSTTSNIGHRTLNNQLAYIIYTSGSTGKPKGVMLEHRSVVNYIVWAARQYIKGEKVNFPLYTSIAFDLTVTSLFVPLITGNSIIIYRGEEGETPIDRIEKIIQDERIGVVKLTPPHLGIVKEMQLVRTSRVKRFIVGGENLESRLADEIHKKFDGKLEIYNEYGPTEATVGCMIHLFDPGKDQRPSVPIGVPADNLKIYILDKFLKPVSTGVAGELCIAGDGLARGYLNRPELTAEKFSHDLWDCQDYHDGYHRSYRSHRSHIPYLSYIYRSGDLARWLPDGNIEFLGRIDHQVKIRGFRIEPGEIENCLLRVRGVKEAVVLAREESIGDKYICAYTVSDSEYEISEVREFLSKELPDYMIPSYFVPVEKIPLTPNGKVDRKALPEPELNVSKTYLSPRNEIETKLVELWGEVLGRDALNAAQLKKSISIDDNFFFIGGDSIKAIRIISRLSQAGYRLEMKDLFQYPVISDLAPRVKKLKRIPDQSTITGVIPLSPIQRRFFEQSHIDSHHYNQAVMFYSKEEIDEAVVKEIFSKIQQHNDALRMTYHLNTENGEIVQLCNDLNYPLSLQVYDLRKRENGIEELQTKAKEIQASIDLAKGPLMKLGLFHMEDGDRLLIAIHHLVIDGVSWRILFEDIETLYGQYKRDEKLTLPPKTDSFKLWVENLSLYADSQLLFKEKAYWAQLEKKTAPLISKDFEVDESLIEDTRSLSVDFGEDETALLLTKVNKAFNTEINDILLAALGLCIKKTFGLESVLLALEGHGREEILEDIDITRTVGWYTSLYPVLLDLSYSDDLGRQIKEIKETLRRIPNKGIGYGIIKYLTHNEYKQEIEFKLNPQISFNYLGQFDEDDNRESFFKIAEESTGNTLSFRNRREFILDAGGMIANHRLSMTFSYNKKHFKPQNMTALAENFKLGLKQIIRFCTLKKKTEHTPGDFTYKGLSIEQLDQLIKMYPDIKDIYRLSPMQEGMLFHALVDELSYSYFEQMSYRLKGDLNASLVEKSINELFKRHDILRTAFVYKNVECPVQVVLRNRVVDFYYEDISKIGEQEERESYIEKFKVKDKERSFDLSKDVLMRVSILKVDHSEYEFIWSFHHIMMDGWCIGILNTEFFEIYTSYLENRPYRLPVLKSYRTYIQWLEKHDKEASIRYWENYLDSFEEQTGIPRTKISKEGNRYINAAVSVVLDIEKTAGLNKLAGRNHVTLNIITQTLWGILLGKYIGKDDVVFGTVVSGRPSQLPGVESMVGLFINTIPLRICFEEKMKFSQLLQKIQNEALDSIPYHYHPLAEIQSRTALKQHLIDHIFVFENYPIAEQIEGYGKERATNTKLSLKIDNVEIFEQTNYDFSIVLGGSDILSITFQYNGNVYDGDFVERISQHFCFAVDQVVNNQELEIRELKLLSEEEKTRVLYEFNNTEADYPKGNTIHRLFEEQVERTPGKIVVVGPSLSVQEKHLLYSENMNTSSLFTQISYNELDKKSNRLAHQLQTKGVGPDTIVGIMIERSVEMIIGILGILKAGGAYLPIDTGYPQERVDYMLRDSGAELLLASPGTQVKVKAVVGQRYIEIIDISDLSSSSPLTSTSICQVSPANLSYIIYTSGTTGKPKGTLVAHQSLVNLCSWHNRCFQVTESDYAAQYAALGFDASVWETFPYLVAGSTLHILRDEIRLESERLNNYFEENHITITFLPTQVCEEFMALDNRSLRILLTGGDKLNQYIPRAYRLVNNYGPTENTVVTTSFSIDRDYENIPIGKPIANIQTYILDNHRQLQPTGIPGELCIGGEGLARGYLNQPEFTAEKFDHNLWVYQDYHDKRQKAQKVAGKNHMPSCIHASIQYHYPIYRTGDLSRWLPDGNIEFLGRIDHQVKIRGFRIEPGEIENCLSRISGVKEAVVSVREVDGRDKYICAYFVSDNEHEISEVQEFLSKELPNYIIPSYFIRLEKIPLTPNGKIDRKALPEPERATGESYAAPRDEVETKMAEIWSEALVIEKEKIGIDSNFFELGGHSLKATILAAKIHKEFEVRVPLAEIFKAPRIEALAGYIKERSKDIYMSVKSVEKKEYYPLSSAQKRLYILQQMQLDSTAYNIPEFIPLEMDIDFTKIEGTFKKLISRHENFHTFFYMVNNEPVQRIHDEVEFEIEFYKGQVEGKHDRVDPPPSSFKIYDFVRPFIRPFDLSQAPLLRVGLTTLQQEKHLLMVDMHHIIADGVSHEVLIKDFLVLYEGEELLPLRIQYKDFSQWQNGEKEKEKIKQQEKYWLKEFSGEIPVLELPTDYPRPKEQSFKGNSVNFEITGEETQGLKQVALKGSSTLFMVLTAVLNILLSKLSGQEDIIIGTPIAGRRHADLEKIIGMFVNTLALRNYPSGDRSLREFLGDVKERTLKAFENQEYQFEELVDKLSVKRDIGRNPLFDIMFVLQNMETVSASQDEDTKIENSRLNQHDSTIEYENILQAAKFDLTLSAAERGRGLFFSILYCTKLFKKETIERFVIYFKKIISIAVNKPGIRISDMEIISQEEKNRLLYEFNDTEEDYPKDKTIHRLFEEQVERTPDNIVLHGCMIAWMHGEEGTITYNELNEKSNGLAELLIDRGVQPDTIVGIKIERSVDMIIGILGILKAGGAYLPIDLEYPGERIDYMLEDSGAKLLVTNNDLEKIPNTLTSQLPNFRLSSATSLAYTIYTSGTTGIPKGTLIRHQGIVNYTSWRIKSFRYTEKDVTLQPLPYSFDGFGSNLYPGLLSGGTLLMIPDHKKLDFEYIRKVIKLHRVTNISLVPSMYQLFLEGAKPGDLGSLRFVVLGGEKSGENLIKLNREKTPQVLLINEYGPTEATLTAAFYPGINENNTNIIGTPISNASIYILDQSRQLVPSMVLGEIYIGGLGMARGYLNRQELTAEKFVDNPFRSGQKMYKTGDLSQWLPNGNIEFMGRIDHQVKIRGFRIELGEIENCLLRFSGVKEVVVSVREEDGGDKYICAYFVSDNKYEISEVQEFLSKELPNYMIPSYVVRLEKIPLTPNGKVDLKALPGPESTTGESYIAPRDEVETKLAELWSEVLAIEKANIGIDTNFFESGGHSLKATILVSKIHKKFEVRVPLAEIFKAPRLEALARYIKGKSKDIYMSVKSVEKKEYYPLSPAQKRIYILQQMQLDRTAYNMPNFIPLDMDTDLTKLKGTFKKLIARHETFNTSFYMINDKPVQRVHDEVEFEIEYYDLSTDDTEGTEKKPFRSKNYIKNFIRPFDFSSAPLLRVAMIKPAGGGTDTGNRHGHAFLMVDMHHIISDGVSHGVLIKDFLALYEGEELQPLRIQYKDFSQWQNGEKEKEKIKQQERYWLKEFPGEIPVLALPTDYPRPKEQSFEGNSVNFQMTGEETRDLKTVALKESSTLFMVLTAIFNILLSKLSGQEDIIIGTPIAGRRHADLEKIIGMFVNTLSLRNYPSGERSFREFLGDVKGRTFRAFENQGYPFEELVDKLSVKRDLGRNPLFDIMLSLQNIDAGFGGQDKKTEIVSNQPGQTDSPKEYETIFQATKFDLSFTVEESSRGLFFSIRYCTKLFKKETIERYINYFRKIVSITVKEPGIRLSEIEITSEEEKNRLLYEFNDTNADYPKGKTIHRLFEEQVKQTPGNIAIVAPCIDANHESPQQITYKELNERSNRLAHQLHTKGVGPDTIVGIMIERSVEMIIGILGILKAGGAYLPIDTEYPQERIDYMLRDSGAEVLLVSSGTQVKGKAEVEANPEQLRSLHLQPVIKVLPLNSTLTSNSIQVSSANLAYIIYTSGSTGLPKGVMVEHGNLANLVEGLNREIYCRYQQKLNICLVSPFIFDASIKQIFAALLLGHSMNIVPGKFRFDGELLLQYFARYNIDITDCTPSHLRLLIENMRKDLLPVNVQHFIVGGEALTRDIAEEFFNKFDGTPPGIINIYGPTECTVDSTFFELSYENIHPFKMNIPIGKPMPNCRVYIVDKFDRLQPIGLSGELLVGGNGVGRGYLGKPELTSEKFIFDHFTERNGMDNSMKYRAGVHPARRGYKSNVLYRTGDLVRRLSDGNIEFLGRIDHQVKIRGFRIELGEIENCLLRISGVKEAVVLAREKDRGDKYLCAYIVSDSEYGISELRENLSKELPDYMIPSNVVRLEKIPLTANGKIDRKALPGPDASLAPEGYLPPRDETEEKLTVIWADVLGIEKEKIGVGHNFFELGGNSLSLVTMVSKIYKELGLEIPITQIYHTPLISEISKLILTKNFQEDPVVLLNKANKKKIFCFPPQIGYGIFYLPLSRILDDYSFYAFSFIEYLEPAARLKEYVDIIKDLQPVGSYILYGYSAAGGLVFQVTKALENRGCDVSDIILFDCFFTENSPREVVREELGDFYQYIDDLLESMQVSSLKEKVVEKAHKYMEYYRSITNLEKINAHVHLVLSDEAQNNEHLNPNCWKHLTSKIFKVYNGYGGHQQMFSSGNLEKNVKIMRKILDKSKFGTKPGGNE